MNDTLEQLRPVDVFENGITNEDAVDSIPRPVKTADDTSPSGKTQPATATFPYYKLFRCVQIAGSCDVLVSLSNRLCGCSYADRLDVLLMTLGLVGAAVNGTSQE